ncbi:hypothetical protein F4802DRAFT_435929 [Xylaria palmicola]|nr:hypothetical protein F4802DRAFT_435929 [Xylaria palmicola]
MNREHSVQMLLSSALGLHRLRRHPYGLTTPAVSGPLEIVPAAACSLVATCYVIQRERVPPSTHERRTLLGADISHGLLLASCIVLGCCVSSYRHRMRESEPYWGTVLLFWIASVVLLGLGVGCEIDTVLVAMLPWALVAAMLTSYVGRVSAQRLMSKRKAHAAVLN